MPKESGWVTINGVHVFIDNSGKISKGPAKFIGSTVNDLPSSGKSAADRKAELKAKYGDKKSGAKTEPESSPDSPKSGETMRDFLSRVSKYPDRSRTVRTRGAIAGTAKFNPTSEKKTGVKEKVKEAVETGKEAFEDSMAAIKGRPDPKPGETMGDYAKRTGFSLGASSRTRGRGAASSESSSSGGRSFTEVESAKRVKSTGKYTVKFKDGSTVKMSESEYDSLYSGPEFDKQLRAKEKTLMSLEGKAPTAKNIETSLDRGLGRTIIGGRTSFTNSHGDTVSVGRSFRGTVEAEIIHPNGNVSIVTAPTKGKSVDLKAFAKMVEDPSFHSNSPFRTQANTGNAAFDNATSTTKKKIK